jgi:hypothetical protein
MPKGNREAKKPKKEKPKTTAAAASAKGTGGGPKKQDPRPAALRDRALDCRTSV